MKVVKCGEEQCCCTCLHQVYIRSEETDDIIGTGCTAYLHEERTVYVGQFVHGVPCARFDFRLEEDNAEAATGPDGEG